MWVLVWVWACVRMSLWVFLWHWNSPGPGPCLITLSSVPSSLFSPPMPSCCVSHCLSPPPLPPSLYIFPYFPLMTYHLSLSHSPLPSLPSLNAALQDIRARDEDIILGPLHCHKNINQRLAMTQPVCQPCLMKIVVGG